MFVGVVIPVCRKILNQFLARHAPISSVAAFAYIYPTQRAIAFFRYFAAFFFFPLVIIRGAFGFYFQPARATLNGVCCPMVNPDAAIFADAGSGINRSHKITRKTLTGFARR